MNKHGADRSLKLPSQVFVFLFVIATVLGLAESVAWYAELTSLGVQASFASGLLWHFLEIYLWLALCPLIFAVNRRFPLAPPRIHIYLLHVLMAIIFPSLTRLLGLSIDRLVGSGVAAHLAFTFRYLAVSCAYRTPGQMVMYSLILALFCAHDYYEGLRKEEERRALLEINWQGPS